jgi:hypothetical protein
VACFDGGRGLGRPVGRAGPGLGLTWRSRRCSSGSGSAAFLDGAAAGEGGQAVVIRAGVGRPPVTCAAGLMSERA